MVTTLDKYICRNDVIPMPTNLEHIRLASYSNFGSILRWWEAALLKFISQYICVAILPLMRVLQLVIYLSSCVTKGPRHRRLPLKSVRNRLIIVIQLMR